MRTLTGFADEISPELDVQLDTLAAEDMHFLELRGVWGKNVLRLADQEVAPVKRERPPALLEFITRQETQTSVFRG